MDSGRRYTMTRKEAIFQFFRKSIVPVAGAALLECIFKSACMKDGAVDYLWLWILCGLPFGLYRMWLWFVPGGSSLGGGVALFVLNFIILSNQTAFLVYPTHGVQDKQHIPNHAFSAFGKPNYSSPSLCLNLE